MAYTLVENLSDAVPEVPPDSIVSRTIFSDADAKVVLFGFAKGQSLSEHTAAIPALLHVLEGRALVALDGDSHELAAGAWLHMPPKMPHSVEALTPATLLLVLLGPGRDE